MKITVFTPTYNRAYILPELYQSMLRQNCYDFEWLVIDDGSTDGTEALVTQWAEETSQFAIRYYKTANGGKPRAINKALELIENPYIFIIDSDDYMTDDVLEFLNSQIGLIDTKEDIAGIGLMRGNTAQRPLGHPRFGNRSYIDAPNRERKNYGLNFDCNEMYKVEVLKKFPFQVWPGELFAPEEISLDSMGLAGYKIRWFNKVGVISEYLSDGLTVNAFGLMQKNPMGYAMLFNHHLKYKKSFKERFSSAYLMVCYAVLGKNPAYLLESNDKLLTLVALPVGLLVAVRRLLQYKNR